MPYSVIIDTQQSEGEEGWYINDIQTTPHEFITRARADGGILLPFHDGCAPFIPWTEVTQLFFDDGTHVCDHQQSTPEPPKDLTIN